MLPFVMWTLIRLTQARLILLISMRYPFRLPYWMTLFMVTPRAIIPNPSQCLRSPLSLQVPSQLGNYWQLVLMRETQKWKQMISPWLIGQILLKVQGFPSLTKLHPLNLPLPRLQPAPLQTLKPKQGVEELVGLGNLSKSQI